MLGVGKQEDLSNDLESDPFLNTALQRFTCDMYYHFGGMLAPVSVAMITGRHYAKNSSSILYGTKTPTVNQQKTVTKQKNPIRVEQGKRLVEYNRQKKRRTKKAKYTDY